MCPHPWRQQINKVKKHGECSPCSPFLAFSSVIPDGYAAMADNMMADYEHSGMGLENQSAIFIFK
jgi:hypothetical protein